MSSSSKKHALGVVVALVLLAIIGLLVNNTLAHRNKETSTEDPELEAMIQELEQQAQELKQTIGN